jgi:hypothetical protein
VNVNAVSTNVPFVMAASGKAPDPEARQAAVNSQADLLNAVRSVKLPAVAAAKLNDGGGVDLYL